MQQKGLHWLLNNHLPMVTEVGFEPTTQKSFFHIHHAMLGLSLVDGDDLAKG